MGLKWVQWCSNCYMTISASLFVPVWYMKKWKHGWHAGLKKKQKRKKRGGGRDRFISPRCQRCLSYQGKWSNVRLLGPAQQYYRNRNFHSLFFSLPPSASRSFDLPEVVVDGERVYADRHSLGGDDGELLAVWAVFVQLVHHLVDDGARPCARELDHLLRVRWVRVDGAVLAAAITEKDDQVVGLAPFQLLWSKQHFGVMWWK